MKLWKTIFLILFFSIHFLCSLGWKKKNILKSYLTFKITLKQYTHQLGNKKTLWGTPTDSPLTLDCITLFFSLIGTFILESAGFMSINKACRPWTEWKGNSNGHCDSSELLLNTYKHTQTNWKQAPFAPHNYQAIDISSEAEIRSLHLWEMNIGLCPDLHLLTPVFLRCFMCSV